MDSSVMASFIVAGCAVVTSMTSLIVNSIANSKGLEKSRNLQIIVKTRIEYMQSLRKANAVFIGLANPQIASHCAGITGGVYVYSAEIAQAAGTLKTLLKQFYPTEKRMIGVINSIENNCINLFINGTTDKLANAIKDELVTYSKLFDQYDWALWQFIMKQSDGCVKNSNMDFDMVYEETRHNIVSHYDYDWI